MLQQEYEVVAISLVLTVLSSMIDGGLWTEYTLPL